MNAEEMFRLRISSLLSRGLSSSQVASEVGLAAASEVWGGDTPRDAPAWCVWLRGSAGAWQLDLLAAERLDGPGVAAQVARLAVRYYPSPEAPELGGFSPEERAFAATSFDGSGTPRIEAASSMPASFFTVGALEWAIDDAAGASLLTLSALQLARTRAGTQGTRPGTIVRELPAWTLTAPVFAALAGVLAQVDRLTLRRLVVTTEPGFEVVVDGERYETRESPEVEQGAAHLLLIPADRAASGEALLNALRDGSATTLLDRSFDGCDHEPASQRGGPFGIPICDAWFGGRVHVEDRSACAC